MVTTVSIEQVQRVQAARLVPIEHQQGFVPLLDLKEPADIVEADLYFYDEERNCVFTHRMT